MARRWWVLLDSSTHSQRAAFFPTCYLLIFIRINNPYQGPHISQGAGQGRQGLTCLMGHMFKTNYIQSGRRGSKWPPCLPARKGFLPSCLSIRTLKMIRNLKEVIIPPWERKVLDATVDTCKKGTTLSPTNKAQSASDYRRFHGATCHVYFYCLAHHDLAIPDGATEKPLSPPSPRFPSVLHTYLESQ